jgi:hypothetical protein
MIVKLGRLSKSAWIENNREIFNTKRINMRVRNPSNIQMNNGQLTDKYGRTFSVDWKAFDKIRKKKEVNVVNVTTLNK